MDPSMETLTDHLQEKMGAPTAPAPTNQAPPDPSIAVVESRIPGADTIQEEPPPAEAPEEPGAQEPDALTDDKVWEMIAQYDAAMGQRQVQHQEQRPASPAPLSRTDLKKILEARFQEDPAEAIIDAIEQIANAKINTGLSHLYQTQVAPLQQTTVVSLRRQVMDDMTANDGKDAPAFKKAIEKYLTERPDIEERNGPEFAVDYAYKAVKLEKYSKGLPGVLEAAKKEGQKEVLAEQSRFKSTVTAGGRTPQNAGARLAPPRQLSIQEQKLADSMGIPHETLSKQLAAKEAGR